MPAIRDRGEPDVSRFPALTRVGPGQVFRFVWAEIDQHADAAQRLARPADVSTVQDQPMMRVREKPLRDDAHQFVFDVARRLAGRDAQPIGESKDMGVDRERRLAEGAAIFCGVSAMANSPGVTLLTPASVVCADSTTATRRVNGLTYSSSPFGAGLAAANSSKIASVLAALATRDSFRAMHDL
jgi:hypothetical protein